MSEENKNSSVISISQSYHDAVETYVKYFMKLTLTALIPAAITTALLAGITASIAFSTNSLGAASDLFALNNGYSWTAVLLVLCTVAVQVVAFIALTYMAVHHERINISTAFSKSFEYIGRFILLALAVMGIVVLGLLLGYLFLMLLGVLIGALSIDLIDPIYEWLNAIPLIVSAALTTLVVFAAYSIVDRDHGTRAAIKHSFHLVRHEYWSIALRVLILYAVLEIVNYGLQFIPIIGSLISLLLLTPFAVIYLYTLYNNLTSIAST